MPAMRGVNLTAGLIGTTVKFISETEWRSYVDDGLRLRLCANQINHDASRMTSLSSWLWGTSQIDDAVGEHNP